VLREVYVNREQIIKELKAERDRLDKAITALGEEPTATGKAPVKARLPQGAPTGVVAAVKPKRQISAESRRKMSEAQKRRREAERKKQ
jgi:hypothetical protein